MNAYAAFRPTTTVETDPPGALSTAVIFDWGLTVQWLVQASAGLLGFHLFANRQVPVLGLIAGAIVFALCGEGLRRGVRGARYLQLAINGFFIVNGIGLALDIPFVVGHQPRDVLSIVVMLTAGTWIIWRMLLPRTREWFATVQPAQALARHDLRWLATVLAASLGAGLVIVVSQGLGG